MIAFDGSRVRATLRTVALAALLGVGGLAAPAMAQAPGFGFGPGFDNHNPLFRVPERVICMSDSQIRQAIADRGYSQISLNVPNDKRVQVRASKGGTVYLIKFNYCSGRIEDRMALRPAR
jgi:hypothetical protein